MESNWQICLMRIWSGCQPKPAFLQLKPGSLHLNLVLYISSLALYNTSLASEM